MEMNFYIKTRRERIRDERIFKIINQGVLTNHPLSEYGQYCHVCNIETPFSDWLCELCGAHSISGDPFSDEFDDTVFEEFQSKIIKLERIFKFKNNVIYYYKHLKNG